MPRRTISFVRTGFHKRRESQGERHYFNLSHIDNELTGEKCSYIDLLIDVWKDENLAHVDFGKLDRSVKLGEAHRIEDGVFLKASAGFVGDPGEVVDTKENNKVLYNDCDGRLSKRSDSRIVYLQQTPDSIRGYFMIEHVKGAGSMKSILMHLLRCGFKKINSDLTVDFETVTMPEKWIKTQAQVKAVKILKYKKAKYNEDLGSDLSQPMRLVYQIVPEKGTKFFSKGFLSNLLSKRLNPYEILAIPELEEEDEISVLLSDGDRQRTMLLDPDNLKTPGWQETISETGESALTDDELIARAREYVQDFYLDDGRR